MKDKILRVTEFKANKENVEELYNFLLDLGDYISNSEGNLSYEVFRSEENGQDFLVLERWEGIADHQKSVDAYPKDKMRYFMAFLSEPPKGRYYF
jgi:quinol monooxygenase YgiN